MMYLTFHGLGSSTRPLEVGEASVWVDPARFTEMLDVVAEHRNDVAVTFDDGNESDAEIALPALRDRGLHATFFVLAGRVGTPASLSWPAVRALRDDGMTIGSHGLAHRDWRTLTDAELEDEVTSARELLEDGLGHAVRLAACPFGAYDRRVLRRLRRAGYERVFTSDGGRAREDRWLAPRHTVHADDDVGWLRAAMAPPSLTATAASAARRLAKRLR
jgi:peptidoglycan/xylan/chitin deacetylase (PgdA/CDA1 family)